MYKDLAELKDHSFYVLLDTYMVHDVVSEQGVDASYGKIGVKLHAKKGLMLSCNNAEYFLL